MHAIQIAWQWNKKNGKTVFGFTFSTALPLNEHLNLALALWDLVMYYTCHCNDILRVQAGVVQECNLWGMKQDKLQIR